MCLTTGGYAALNPYYFLFSAALLRPGYMPAYLGFATTRTEPMEVRIIVLRHTRHVFHTSVVVLPYGTAGGACNWTTKLADLWTSTGQAFLSKCSHATVTDPYNDLARDGSDDLNTFLMTTLFAMTVC